MVASNVVTSDQSVGNSVKVTSVYASLNNDTTSLVSLAGGVGAASEGVVDVAGKFKTSSKALPTAKLSIV